MVGDKGDRPTEQSQSLFPSGQLKMNSFIRGKRMVGGFGDMLFSTYSHTEPLKHVITVRRQILGSRTGDIAPCSPCVHSKRPRVYVQNVPCVPAQHVRVVPVHTGTF